MKNVLKNTLEESWKKTEKKRKKKRKRKKQQASNNFPAFLNTEWLTVTSESIIPSLALYRTYHRDIQINILKLKVLNILFNLFNFIIADIPGH